MPGGRCRTHGATDPASAPCPDGARLRQANRLFTQDRPVTADELCTITQADIRASRVFSGGLDPDGSGSGRKDDPHEL